MSLNLLYMTLVSGNNFFHLVQLFSIADNGPTYTLDLYKSKAAIRSYVDGNSADGNGDTLLASVADTSFFNRTLINTVSVTWGASGSMSYSAVDATSGASVLKASATGYTGSGGC